MSPIVQRGDFISNHWLTALSKGLTMNSFSFKTKTSTPLEVLLHPSKFIKPYKEEQPPICFFSTLQWTSMPTHQQLFHHEKDPINTKIVKIKEHKFQGIAKCTKVSSRFLIPLANKTLVTKKHPLLFKWWIVNTLSTWQIDKGGHLKRSYRDPNLLI